MEFEGLVVLPFDLQFGLQLFDLQFETRYFAAGQAAVVRVDPAEDYHQEYFERNGRQPYGQAAVAPKVSNFRKEYFDRLKR